MEHAVDGFMKNIPPGVIVTLGNPPGKGKARKRTMAKRRMSKKQRAAALRNLKKARSAQRGRSTRRRGASRKSGRTRTVTVTKYRNRRASSRKRRRHVSTGARRNAPMLGGWVNLPTGGEVVAIGVAALALPTVTRYITNLIPVAALQGDSLGNIAAEFGVAALASGAARKFGAPRVGDAILLLGTARAVGRVAFKFSNGTIGFAEDGSDVVPELGAYTDPRPALGAYTDAVPQMGASPAAGYAVVDGSGAF